MPSSNAMSDNIYNYDQDGGEPFPDNYDEGWYQDESENWLNQFDWKQVSRSKNDLNWPIRPIQSKFVISNKHRIL